MTARQYNRLRKWDLATQPAYNAGVMDGMDAGFCDLPRPCDPDEGYDAPFDLNFYWRPRRRYEQQILNHNLARQRGRVDGWDMAKQQMREAEEEEALLTEVEDGLQQIEAFLRERAA